MPKKRSRTHRKHVADNSLRTEKWYPVYARKVVNPEVVLGEEPLLWVDAKTREIWLSQNAVASYSRGKMLRLLLNLPPTIQPSVAMGEGILDGVAAGKPYALECAEAYRHDYAPYCNYPRMAA